MLATKSFSRDRSGVPTVLVTGAAGFIGRSVVTRLLQRGWRVKAMVRRLEASERLPKNDRLEIVQADMRDAEALRPVHPQHGSSVHYASTLPFSTADKPLTTEPSGRLRGTRIVYIADGAAFRYLPAKGLTSTLMANANRVGQQVARSMD